jgi:predicted Zn-ribbon and HTH transcriptional regulator
MSHRYDRTGERVEDDERTDEEAALDHIAEIRRILASTRKNRPRWSHICCDCGSEFPAHTPRPVVEPRCPGCSA